MDIPENEISDFVSPESCIAPAAVDITCSDDAIVASLKRPREDSISMTDCEARTPERSWSNENLTLKASVSVASMDGIDAFHYAEQVIWGLLTDQKKYMYIKLMAIYISLL